MTSKPRIGLYDSHLEKMHIAWPLVILGTVSVLYAIGFDTPKGNFVHWSYFISGTLFLNIIHNGFTFYAVTCLPEGKQWVDEKSKTSIVHLYVQWGMIFTTLVMTFFILTSVVKEVSPNFVQGVAIFLAMVTGHHTIRQHRGLSLLYNRALNAQTDLTPQDRTFCIKLERAERILFSLITITFVAAIFFATAAKRLPSSLQIDLSYFCYLSWLLATLLVGTSMLYPAASQSNKSLFNLRLFLCSMITVYPIAAIANSCIHGIEYSFMFHKMNKSSSQKFSIRQAVILAGLSLLIICFYLAESSKGLGWLVQPSFPDHLRLLRVLSAFSAAGTVLHFYIDRQFFRMSDPLNQKHLGPLLVASLSNESVPHFNMVV